MKNQDIPRQASRGFITSRPDLQENARNPLGEDGEEKKKKAKEITQSHIMK